ncbi:hypothetical protein [Kineosporia sp. A_224]|uniref:hypothetical protein n=1 Tax=Kineosporia sp. A_224 TaxID=1962180 RepID=UPI001179E6DD|nr:hypothetical protein [Kineosporia sp. A_224]
MIDITEGLAQQKLSPEESALTYAALYAYERFTRLSQHPIQRATELVEARPSSLARTVTVTFKLPRAENFFPEGSGTPLDLEWVVFPLTAARRGKLLNGFEATDSAGQRLQILPRTESKRLASNILEIAWDATFGDVGELDQELAARFSSLKLQVLEVPRIRPSEAPGQCVSLLSSLDELVVDGAKADHGAMLRLQELATYFGKRTIIWARHRAHPGETVVVTYSYEATFSYTNMSPAAVGGPWEENARLLSPSKARFRRARWMWLWARALVGTLRGNESSIELFRTWMGQPPNRIFIPVGMLHLSESYHLRVDVPSSNYVSEQSLVVRRRSDPSGKVLSLDEVFAEEFSKGADYRGADQSGGTYAHLYTYLLHGRRAQRVYAAIEFRERPPGSTGVALALGLSVLGLNLFVAIGFLLLLKLATSAVDVVAILLTVPVFVTVWLGRSLASDADSYARTPILSRIALIVFGGSSVATALTMMLSMALVVTYNPPVRWLLLPWAAVCLLCVPVGWMVMRLAGVRSTAMREYRQAADGLPAD